MGLARRIHQLPAADRPREKLRARGASALSDFELLEVVIGNGVRGTDVGSIARQVQRLLRRGSAALNYESLTALKGVSAATAGKLLAAFELAQRHLIRDAEPLRSLQDIIGYSTRPPSRSVRRCDCRPGGKCNYRAQSSVRRRTPQP